MKKAILLIFIFISMLSLACSKPEGVRTFSDTSWEGKTLKIMEMGRNNSDYYADYGFGYTDKPILSETCYALDILRALDKMDRVDEETRSYIKNANKNFSDPIEVLFLYSAYKELNIPLDEFQQQLRSYIDETELIEKVCKSKKFTDDELLALITLGDIQEILTSEEMEKVRQSLPEIATQILQEHRDYYRLSCVLKLMVKEERSKLFMDNSTVKDDMIAEIHSLFQNGGLSYADRSYWLVSTLTENNVCSLEELKSIKKYFFVNQYKTDRAPSNRGTMYILKILKCVDPTEIGNYEKFVLRSLDNCKIFSGGYNCVGFGGATLESSNYAIAIKKNLLGQAKDKPTEEILIELERQADIGELDWRAAYFYIQSTDDNEFKGYIKDKILASKLEAPLVPAGQFGHFTQRCCYYRTLCLLKIKYDQGLYALVSEMEDAIRKGDSGDSLQLNFLYGGLINELSLKPGEGIIETIKTQLLKEYNDSGLSTEQGVPNVYSTFLCISINRQLDLGLEEHSDLILKALIKCRDTKGGYTLVEDEKDDYSFLDLTYFGTELEKALANKSYYSKVR